MTHDESNILTDHSKFLDDSKEHLTYASLSVYRNLSDVLSRKEKIFFSNHLAVCPDCSMRLQEVEDVELREIKKNYGRIFGFSPNIFRYAIAALLIVSVGIAVLIKTQNVQQENTVPQKIVEEKQIAETIIDPEKFVPNQVLENFVERTVRSGQNISILTPAVGDTLSFPYTIRWQGPKENYTVTIVNNNNVEIWKRAISSSEIVVNNKLDAGLYYLKLEVNEKLALVGKFVVIH